MERDPDLAQVTVAPGADNETKPDESGEYEDGGSVRADDGDRVRRVTQHEIREEDAVQREVALP